MIHVFCIYIIYTYTLNYNCKGITLINKGGWLMKGYEKFRNNLDYLFSTTLDDCIYCNMNSIELGGKTPKKHPPPYMYHLVGYT